jgi:LuxR family maltose regulon positive regulatory protein
LNEGLRRKLTLISAPAGYGKSTLVSEWIRHVKLAAGWLSLDQEDNDPTRFWTYLLAALRNSHAGLGEATLRLLQAPQPPPILTILTSLLNEIAALDEEIVLVLDDYHLISTPAIHEGLAFILEHQPPGLHLVLLTRADPPLPISQLRARSQLVELRQADLRFTPEETARFLNKFLELDLSDEDLSALDSRTEGWAVGLQLAGLSLQGRADVHQFIRSFTGSHHYVVEYLTEEILRRQTERIQHFLVKTSILDRLCAPLCNAVTGEENGAELLQQLQKNNLFLISLDEEQYWYRYHHLFADVLNGILKKDFPQEDILALHRRASRWHEQNGTLDETIKHTIEGQDEARAADLIDGYIQTRTTSEELSTLLTWIDVLPPELIQVRPRLCLIKAWAFAFGGQFDSVEQWLQFAEEATQRSVNLSERGRILGNVATLRAFVADRTGDSARALDFAQKADELLPEDELSGRSMLPYILGRAYRIEGDLAKASQANADMERFGRAAGNVMTVSMALCEQATLFKLRGQLHLAADIYHQAAQFIKEHDDGQFVTSALFDVGLSDLSYEQNKQQYAREKVEPIIEYLDQMQWGGSPTDLVLAYTVLARLLGASGDFKGAAEVLTKARQARRHYNDFPGFESTINACQVGLWLRQENLSAANRWAEEYSSVNNEGILSREQDNITLARVQIALNEFDQALNLLRRLEVAADSGGRFGRLIEILNLQAVAHQGWNDTEQAMVSLSKSLALAGPEGYIRVYLDEGKPMANLFMYALERGLWENSPSLMNYLSKLQDAFQGEKILTQPQASPEGAQLLVEPLSGRELEVLRLIAKGYSNREIAETLVITLNTVKKHTSNIYGKLGVSKRTQAVARAQNLGIL